MRMRITSCGITDVGMKRTHNEDNFLINDELQLFIVCDGMGGHVGGEVASAIAVHTLEEAFISLDWNSKEKQFANRSEFAREQLRFAVRIAGKKIYETAQQEPRYMGMGTTCLALFVDHSNAFLGHVGDSRGYLIRNNQIQQLTEDHSWVNERINAGLMTPEEAKNHRFKNVITRSLGINEEVEVDVLMQALRKDDYLVLCSDGLSNLVEADEICSICIENSPQEAGRKLVNLACERGGDDNITVVILRVDEAP